jgi:hypothetical protein
LPISATPFGGFVWATHVLVTESLTRFPCFHWHRGQVNTARAERSN